MDEFCKAVADGDISSMNAFMDEDDFDIDAKDGAGLAALHHAAMAGEAAGGSLLVECSADVNVVDREGNTPLMLAGRHDKRLVASMLLWGGADRDAVNDKGNTALHEAAASKAQDVAWLIVENGGDQCMKVENNEGKTPLDIATEAGADEEMLAMLQKALDDVS
mmetsp:Transcript_22702/g.59203  ORF Transcript_22702/g.59203 Transcript_22702/m.59203 type:complete len:164 (+) Transcript_22702:52-543(+)